MNTPTYKEQFDKLTRAYIANEVNPYNGCQCFCGNLFGTEEWRYGRNGYTATELIDMECVFMSTVKDLTIGGKSNYFVPDECKRSTILTHENYENALFTAFELTLDELKQIHISKGEIIDETPIFTKRSLKQTI